MAKDGQIVMNNKFYAKLVDVIGKVSMPEDGLSLEDRLNQTPTLKNGVFYVAGELSKDYKGVWELANCADGGESFLILSTDEFMNIKQDSDNEDYPVMEANVDGRVFGFISSLIALGIIWYIAGSRKGMNASLYSKSADSLECSLCETTTYFLSGDGRKDITQDEFREIESMSAVVTEFTRHKYKM